LESQSIITIFQIGIKDSFGNVIFMYGTDTTS